MTATAPSVLLTRVTNWTIAVAWILGSFRMDSLITSTSLLVLRLSTAQEAGAKCAALQISDAIPYVLLLAAPARPSPPGSGNMTRTASSGSHPAAFASVFLPMADVALVGA
ncbi:hypothetical protein [Streptomyces mirabilis]|uniref:hypothetical protein n=1 Tax=Streptomyces mirabilis TaxID=68239 RepID=UPI0036911748